MVLQKIFWALIALGVLVTLHELGHFSVARLCGVRVLRFAVGFGPRVWGWTSRTSGTEYVIGALPLGGYVKMLDEREAPVDAALRHQAFNTQALHKRFAIVAAGPLVNLALAVLLYATVAWSGQLQTAPVLPSPLADSIAARAGLQGGERATTISLDGDEPVELRSFEDLRWWITRATLQGQDLRLQYQSESGHGEHSLLLPLGASKTRQPDATTFREIGWVEPRLPAVIADVVAGGPAQAAGLQRGDLVLATDGRAVRDASQLRERIRQSGSTGFAQPQQWRVLRDGMQRDIVVAPKVVVATEGSLGRIEAALGAQPETVMVRYGVLEGLGFGFERTWQVSSLSLSILGRMLIGEASVKNLSGPITIADYAGQSAAHGASSFLLFLALVSVSLGVLNLLPLPVLDGGHLVYYLWEGLTGRPVSDLWMERLQRFGFFVLLLMMSIAIFNDLTRYLG